MSATDAVLSIGQVAARTGLSVHTLRLYEREGLLTGPLRRVSGRRVYTEWDVQWLVNCTRFRASGMPLATLRRLAQLVGEGPGNEAERLTLLREHQQRVVDQMEVLSGALDLITAKVASYEKAVAAGTADKLWTAR
jgi:DNA-binding transcriptional MerR regulator